MISKQQQKYVQSLHNKKYRNEFKEFLVEGEKAIYELLLSDFEIKNLYITEKAKEKLSLALKNVKYTVVNEDNLGAISTLKNNNSGVAVVSQKKQNYFTTVNQTLTLVLDEIKDPGNLGTIIRLADWYGLKQIVCSENTVEFYNPKVIAATMGSFLRINCFYTDTKKFIKDAKFSDIYGAFLEGENIHKCELKQNSILVIGSESHGINPDLEALINHKITIPNRGKAESLNAAVATGIILDNFYRNS